MLKNLEKKIQTKIQQSWHPSRSMIKCHPEPEVGKKTTPKRTTVVLISPISIRVQTVQNPIVKTKQ